MISKTKEGLLRIEVELSNEKTWEITREEAEIIILALKNYIEEEFSSKGNSSNQPQKNLYGYTIGKSNLGVLFLFEERADNITVNIDNALALKTSLENSLKEETPSLGDALGMAEVTFIGKIDYTPPKGAI